MWRRLGFVLLFALSLTSMPLKAWSEPNNKNFTIDIRLKPIEFNKIAGLPDPNGIFKLVNQARSVAGVPPLRANKTLENIATYRAKDMERRQYYAHQNPDGHYYYDLFKAAKLDPDYSCENLDMTYVLDSQAPVNDWLSSTRGHRECLLNQQVVEAGYAVARFSIIDLNGKATTEYVVVAIQASALLSN